MMTSTSKAIELVEQLEDNLDDLDEILQPLLSQSLSESTKKLPLLDRAKLHITVVYAIESLLFSYLKVNGVDAKTHPVFRELTRVKQYFEKVKDAENGPVHTPLRDMSLDKQAALRMIKHSLAGNNKIDLERAEAEARQKLLAKRKLKMLESSMKDKAAANDQSKTDIHVTPAEEQEIADIVASAADEMTSTTLVQNGVAVQPAAEADSSNTKKKKKEKKRKQSEVEKNDQEEISSKKSKGERRKARKEKKHAREVANVSNSTAEAG